MGRQGKAVKANSIGRALERRKVLDNAARTSRGNGGGEGMGSGGNGGRRLTSVLEASSVDDFISNSMLNEKELESVSGKDEVIVLHEMAMDGGEQTENEPEFVTQHLCLPKKPPWTEDMSVEELDRNERIAMLDWRKALSALEESSGRPSTPYEKNIEVWRQLWRVLDRSDLLVHIVDGRNPLFYFSEDLVKIAASMEPPRRTLVLFNKSDFLSLGQRRAWADYFSRRGLEVYFFSALRSLSLLKMEGRIRQDSSVVGECESENIPNATNGVANNELRVLLREELLSILKREAMLTMEGRPSCQGGDGSGICAVRNQGRTCIGMVGYPNVGKSSIINALVGATPTSHDITRVSVGATPGKTKHFQTLVLQNGLLICDCPGLVFPSIVSSEGEMQCAGVVPLMQLRDPFPAASIIARRIPRHCLEIVYNIALNNDTDNAELSLYSRRIAIAENLLRTLCKARGFIRAQSLGEPDYGRAARLLLSDYTCGKLVYCHPPPDLTTEEVQSFLKETERVQIDNARLTDKLKYERLRAGLVVADGSKGTDKDSLEDVQAVIRRRQETIAITHSNRPRGPTRAEQGRKRWGKKERKMRDNNPYGGNGNSIGMDETSNTPHQRHAGGRKKPNRKAAKHEERRQNTLYNTCDPPSISFDV